jgi:hypothetical protein
MRSKKLVAKRLKVRIVNWLNQNQGLVMTVLTLVYVVATLAIVFLTLKATRLSQKTVDTAIALEKNRLRPYVLFNISSSIANKTTYASIKNLGLTAAYKVRVSIQPKLEHLHDVESPLTARDILFLPPGEEITDVIDSSPAFHQKYPNPLFEGTVEYENSDADKFQEPFRIDLTFLKKRLYVRQSSVVDELNQVNETLAVIAKHLERNESNVDSVPQDEI